MGLSIGKLLLILLVVGLVFGAGKLRHLGADLGSAIRNFRAALGDGDDRN